jgi:hypothetical protein
MRISRQPTPLQIKIDKNPVENVEEFNYLGARCTREIKARIAIIEGKIIGTRRRGRRHKQLLDDLRKARRYWKLKEEAQDRTLWRTQFGRGYEAVARQTTT